jgi:hypothetical protein
MLNLVNKETETNSSTGVWIKCPSLQCGNYEWLYRGRFFIYATCPSCKRNVLISNNKIERPLQSGELGRHNQIEAASV